MVGRSLRQIIWARLRRDRVAMVCLIILIAFYLIGIFGPVIAGMYGISPYTLDANAISDFAGKPYGAFGGISAAHPLGVEWGTAATSSPSCCSACGSRSSSRRPRR